MLFRGDEDCRAACRNCPAAVHDCGDWPEGRDRNVRVASPVTSVAFRILSASCPAMHDGCNGVWKPCFCPPFVHRGLTKGNLSAAARQPCAHRFRPNADLDATTQTARKTLLVRPNRRQRRAHENAPGHHLEHSPQDQRRRAIVAISMVRREPRRHRRSDHQWTRHRLEQVGGGLCNPRPARRERQTAVPSISPKDLGPGQSRRRQGPGRKGSSGTQPTSAPVTDAIWLAAAGHGSFATNRATGAP